MFVSAGAVALAMFSAFIFRKPERKVSTELLEGISNLNFSHENINTLMKAQENIKHISEVEKTIALTMEEQNNKGCAINIMKFYGKIFSTPAMAVYLGK